MKSINNMKKEKMFLRDISYIISEKLTNVNISDTTVTDVKLSSDNSHLNVFLTFSNNKNKSLQFLNNSKGFVKKQLSRRSNLRKVPELNFKHDESRLKGNRIDDILKKIKKDSR